jgi:hypothetical protein
MSRTLVSRVLENTVLIAVCVSAGACIVAIAAGVALVIFELS